MKHYMTIGSRMLSIVFLFIMGYELTCGVFLWSYYMDRRTALLYILKGCIALLLFLLLFYEPQLSHWYMKRKGRKEESGS